MSGEAFRQAGRRAAYDLRLEALPWDIDLKRITVPVDIWHGLDDTIVRWERADILAHVIPGAQRPFIADQGHFSMSSSKPPGTWNPSVFECLR